MSSTVIFRAREILTMAASSASATHVAVRDGRILAVGDEDDMRDYADAAIDDRYIDRVVMPGLVEGHSHLYEGGLWQFCHVGFYDRRGPDGTIWPGLKSFDAVVARLREAEAALGDADTPLLAWGFDPIYFPGQRLSNHELDQVSTDRPVAVLHASFHLMNVNSAMMARAGVTRESDIEGVVRHADGEPTGELQEFAAMFPVNRAIGNAFRKGGASPAGLGNFAKLAQLAGVTTATDLSNELADHDIDALATATADPAFPVRLVPAFRAMMGAATNTEQRLERVRTARARNNDKLYFGAIKMILDGSIQGFTARLLWPGYHNGHDNGIWVTSPAEARELISAYHRAGLQLHIHTNGDEATELALDALEQALTDHPRPDHRHTLQHVQMARTSQFRRMRALGVCANLFCNHIFYWGDAHYSATMGPSRAQRMNACATAEREGVPFAMHSDAPITPLGPLFTAWCAVNRQTASGRVLGDSERISVASALRAITLGAAYTLHLDHEIGSIEVGKRADFCVLADNPLACPPEALKDITVCATVVGGHCFDSPTSA